MFVKETPDRKKKTKQQQQQKFNHKKVVVEDLTHRNIDTGQNASHMVSILSVLVRKNHDVNEVIKKVNNLLKTLSLEQGFTFICNSAIARAMLWCDGLHLTNEGTNMLSNNFLQYLKNVPLGNDNRIFTDWQTNQGKTKGSYKGIEEFSPKDPEVPKLSNNTNSKLELSCITNIKKIRSENIDNVIIDALNINSFFFKFDDSYFWDVWYFGNNENKTWWCISNLTISFRLLFNAV